MAKHGGDKPNYNATKADFYRDVLNAIPIKVPTDILDKCAGYAASQDQNFDEWINFRYGSEWRHNQQTRERFKGKGMEHETFIYKYVKPRVSYKRGGTRSSVKKLKQSDLSKKIDDRQSSNKCVTMDSKPKRRHMSKLDKSMCL